MAMLRLVVRFPTNSSTSSGDCRGGTPTCRSPGHGVDGLDHVAGVRHVEHAAVGQRRPLLAARGEAPRPDEAQVAHVLTVHLVERAVAPAVRGAAPRQPVGRRRVFEHRVGDRRERRPAARPGPGPGPRPVPRAGPGRRRRPRRSTTAGTSADEAASGGRDHWDIWDSPLVRIPPASDDLTRRATLPRSSPARAARVGAAGRRPEPRRRVSCSRRWPGRP